MMMVTLVTVHVDFVSLIWPFVQESVTNDTSLDLDMYDEDDEMEEDDDDEMEEDDDDDDGNDEDDSQKVEMIV